MTPFIAIIPKYLLERAMEGDAARRGVTGGESAAKTSYSQQEALKCTELSLSAESKTTQAH